MDWEWFFTGPYSEQRIAMLLAPIILAIYWSLNATKKPTDSDRGGEKPSGERKAVD
jgi:ABC-type spermidine/putrescine transport system permease subunit II